MNWSHKEWDLQRSLHRAHKSFPTNRMDERFASKSNEKEKWNSLVVQQGYKETLPQASRTEIDQKTC